MRSVAFYGKGGIGKSTTLSNVSATLAASDKKILQIGCDPKHDSTRLILGGFTQSTVLEQLNTKGDVSLDSVMLTGFNGIQCIEAGGPEPGVGCAGRGIIQMLNLLKEKGLDTKQFDYVFFDVLGDVVCGGFAVPMRAGYADEVYIVTSGEVAALYAANNIAKGIKRFSMSKGKLGGVIGNGRGTKNEREVISAFARLIGTEMVAFIPRSELIAEAEFDSKPIIEYAPESEVAAVYKSIAGYVECEHPPVVPKPLSDQELDRFLHDYCYNTNSKNCLSHVSTQTSVSSPQALLTQTLPSKKLETSTSKAACSPSTKDGPPVQGCSLGGAFGAVRRVKDSVTIMHAPQGCAYVNFNGFLSRAAQSPFETKRVPNLLCTNVQETDVIFGGTKNLKETVLRVHKQFPLHTIFVVTSCSSGIIGDDIDQVVEELKTENINLVYIPTEGVMNKGDFYTGLTNAYHVVAEKLVDETVAPENNSVNIIGEQTVFPMGTPNCEAFDQILQKLGIKVNCRFIGDTTINEIRQLKKATVNIPFVHDPIVREVTSFLESRFSMETLNAPMPLGFEQTADFTRSLGRRFNRINEAENIINEARSDYDFRLSQLRKYFAGKKALILSSPRNIDWLISTMMDLEVTIDKIYSSSYFPAREPFSTKYSEKILVETDYPMDKFERAIREDRPDFVLTAANAFNKVPCDILPAAVLPVFPTYGFNGGLIYANRLCLKLKYPSIEGWRHDKKLVQGCA